MIVAEIRIPVPEIQIHLLFINILFLLYIDFFLTLDLVYVKELLHLLQLRYEKF